MRFFTIIFLIAIMGLFPFFKRTDNTVLFPKKEQVLDASFASYENFFPIATLDLSSKGILAPLHIVYVSFDPSINDSGLFIKPDYIDEFTFDILSDGKLKPTFKTDALEISDDFSKYFKEGQQKYEKAKKETLSVFQLIDFAKEPSWWQDDQTPKNAKGKPYRFICQIDMDDIVDDDCRMFVFYDKDERKVKCVYQRT